MKAKGWKKLFRANGNQKKAGATILLLGKIDFKAKTNKGQRWSLYNDKGINSS